MNQVLIVVLLQTVLSLTQSAFAASEIDNTGLRQALMALLRLDDGELGSLMKGHSVCTVAETISPTTQFILRASDAELNQLQNLLSTDEGKRLIQEDLKVAKRRKNLINPNQFLNQENYESYDEPDSLLGALADLSAHLRGEVKIRSRRSHRQHKKHYRSRIGHKKVPYSYWLNTHECPKTPEGIPKLFCPSPNDRGQGVCIEDMELCDDHSHCPNGEDENPNACLFYKALKNQLNDLIGEVLKSRRHN